LTQQSNSQVSPLPPARESDETIVETSSSVLVHHRQQYPNTQAYSALQASAETISHQIEKIIKKNSVEYSCNACNTHYSRLSWVIEDHPYYDLKNFNVINLTKQGEVLTL
jgi:hypothetical protein